MNSKIVFITKLIQIKNFGTILFAAFLNILAFVPLKTPEFYGVSKELSYKGNGEAKGFTTYIYNGDSVMITSYDTSNIRVSRQQKIILNSQIQQVVSYDKDDLIQWKQIFIYNSFQNLDTLKEFSSTGNQSFALERFYVAEYDSLKRIRWYRGFEHGSSDPFETNYYEWVNEKISKILFLQVDQSVEKYLEISYTGETVQTIREFDPLGAYKSHVELEYNGNNLSKVSTFRDYSLIGFSTFQYNTSSIVNYPNCNGKSQLVINQISDRVIIQSPVSQVAKISLFSIAGSKVCTVFQGNLRVGRNEIALKGALPAARYLLVNESAGGKYVGSFVKK